MKQQMSAEHERLSALIDGELAASEAGEMLTACRNRARLSDDWSVYHCIGDVLRSDDMACHSGALASKLAARLALEPHLLAAQPIPASALPSRWRHPTASLAAAVAAVAAVAWLALPQLRTVEHQVAAVPAVPAAVPAAGLVASIAQPAPRVANGYVEAHRQYSSSVAAQTGLGLVQSVTFESGR